MTNLAKASASNKVGYMVLPSIAIFVVAAYAGCQIIADIASLKIGLVLGQAVDMGTFIYPLTFTLRDLAHKVLGKRGVRTLVITTAVLNLLMSGYLWLSTLTPSPTDWPLNEAFSAIITPVWRIVFASIVAELVSELLDTEIYHWFRTRTPRFQWARVLLSNAVSIPVDNLIFAFGAFAGILPMPIVWQIFFFNFIVKAVVSIIGIPLIYAIPDTLDTFEQLDK